MGYFPNGCAGDDYYNRYCAHCVHDQDEDNPCQVWGLHLLMNYDACNDKQHPLHWLIPIAESGLDNEQCKMFWPIDAARCRETPDMFKQEEAK